MIQKDADHTFLVDVRTRFEYQDIGHAEGAFNVPFEFYTSKLGEKGYKKVMNDNFCADLKDRFNPKTDSILLMCRSAKRSAAASRAAVECGFDKKKVFNVLAGFEGDKVEDKESPDHGKRVFNGWRNEGLPWTYKMDERLVYISDKN